MENINSVAIITVSNFILIQCITLEGWGRDSWGLCIMQVYLGTFLSCLITSTIKSPFTGEKDSHTIRFWFHETTWSSSNYLLLFWVLAKYQSFNCFNPGSQISLTIYWYSLVIFFANQIHRKQTYDIKGWLTCKQLILKNENPQREMQPSSVADITMLISITHFVKKKSW